MWRTQRHQIVSSPRGHGLLSVWDDTGFRTAKDGRCFGLQNYKMYFEQETVKFHLSFLRFFFHLSHLAQTTQLQLEKILFGIASGLAFFISVPRERGDFWHSTLRHYMPRRFLKANKNTAPPSLTFSFSKLWKLSIQREWLQTRETPEVRSFGRAEELP